MSKHNYSLLTEIISIALIVLFAYTAVSKLADFASFQDQMKAQPLPVWLTSLVVWTLPAMELITGILLILSHTRLTGLYISLVLMLMFSAYVALALAGALGSIPCACGGIIESLGWKSHLAINLVFTGLSLTGIILYHKVKKEVTAT
jgi:hypothetical protein